MVGLSLNKTSVPWRCEEVLQRKGGIAKSQPRDLPKTYRLQTSGWGQQIRRKVLNPKLFFDLPLRSNPGRNDEEFDHYCMT